MSGNPKKYITLNKPQSSIGPVASVLALVVLVSAVAFGASSRASVGVCGDGAVEGGEQCDDGNLVNGDGCSAKCTIERCGNSIIDPGEQCDEGAGNGAPGNRCSEQCAIRFCGDGTVDAGLGEECDDGNGISGDGCSSECLLEGEKKSSSSSSASTDASVASAAASEMTAASKADEDGGGTKVTAHPAAPAPSVEQVVATQAQAVVTFIAGSNGEDYKQYFTSEESAQMDGILKKLSSGRRLTPEEKTQAAGIASKFEQSKVTERDRYVSLLKEFVDTPISAIVVQEQQLSPEKITTSVVQTSIDELSKTVKVLSPQERASQVASDVKKLKRQGIDLEPQVGTDVAAYLGAGNKPIQVFTTIKSVKEAAEQHATKDLPASLEKLRNEVKSLQQSMPILEREYGVKSADINKALSSVSTTLENATAEDTQRVVNAVDHLFTVIERQKVVTKSDILSSGQKNIAAETQRILAEAGPAPKLTADLGTPANALADLAARAPEQAKQSFQEGSLQEQRGALIRFLETDPRLTSIRAKLQSEGRKDIEDRYQSLLRQIRSIGTETQQDTTCARSVSEALQCTHAFLTTAEDAARSQGVLSRMIGTLQDTFGIGQ